MHPTTWVFFVVVILLSLAAICFHYADAEECIEHMTKSGWVNPAKVTVCNGEVKYLEVLREKR